MAMRDSQTTFSILAIILSLSTPKRKNIINDFVIFLFQLLRLFNRTRVGFDAFNQMQYQARPPDFSTGGIFE